MSTKKRTTYPVGPLSYSRMLQALRENWQSGGAGREALREELVPWRTYHVPMSCGDIASALYTEVNREVLILDYDYGYIGKLDLVTLTWKWLRRHNYRFLFGDYHPTYGIVAPSISPPAIVLMDTNGEITNVITTTSLGALGVMSSCRWHFPDGRIGFVDNQHHIAGLLNPNTGVVTNQFGVYGVSGSDLTHLRLPYDIDFTVKLDGTLNKVFIADSGNNRVLKIDASTMTVEHILLMRAPFSCRILRDMVNGRYGLYDDYARSTICIGSISGIGQGLNMVVQADGSRLYGFVPIPNFDAPNLDPHSLRLINTCAARLIYEWDFSGIVATRPNQFSRAILTDRSLGGGATVPTVAYPGETLMSGIGFEEITLYVHSTQAATLYIDVPDKMYGGGFSLYVPTDYSWVERIELRTPLSAGEMNTVILTSPPPIFRPRITMGAVAGVVNIYARGR